MPFCEDANDSTVARVAVDRFHYVADILAGLKEAEGFAKLDLFVSLYSCSWRDPRAYCNYSKGIEHKIMQPVKHLNHFARLRKTGQSVKQCFYNPVDRPFHIGEDIV